jgi:prepilin-type N-terminal cleavage/methylation domain-containing protein
VANNKGFTLPEILVTIVILSIGVCALAGMQVANIKGTSFSKDASIATGLAQARLEALKNTTFDSIVSNTTGVTQSGMNVAWSVTTSGATPNRYHDVSVTVAWGEGSITCCTIITEP